MTEAGKIIDNQPIDVEKKLESLTNLSKVIDSVHIAIGKLTKGVSALLFVVANEMNVLEEYFGTEDSKRIFDDIKEPDVKYAVNNLYSGSRILADVIDDILS
ncbi:hypothetical protein [Viridibacillus sp. FSL H8-0123]|uniref:hypothetical protein n=1 Tax=Viridibacillus sp. FSL H8-0123 TaxID=1928922 RepID=UPI00096C9E0C|nr:hypothetical protein [Viridibacillus sp. FSL H8-0123]OMC77256.1 hypothetical protein BK130_21590 [Viridibacillus sp. FSL H8-0123]